MSRKPEIKTSVLLDGQFGSTGKGLFASFLAANWPERFDLVTTNAGPNSGHTFYTAGYKRHILKQLPTYPVARRLLYNDHIPILLNGGAIIDQGILAEEMERCNIRLVYVHPHAAVITNEHRKEDSATVDRIASTGQGIGPALADKIRRICPSVASDYDFEPEIELFNPYMGPIGPLLEYAVDYPSVLIEMAQGAGLGLHQGFYPCTTARECSVAQGLADAQIAPQTLKNVFATFRTFPIRVGNTSNSSGGCYSDQYEISWRDIGVEPERTTVTGRVRRVFNWSDQQFMSFIIQNQPNILFFNFMNYLPKESWADWLGERLTVYRSALGVNPDRVFVGIGPYTHNVKEVYLRSHVDMRDTNA